MTYILYGIAILLLAQLIEASVIIGILVSQQKKDEIKPAELKPEKVDEKAKKEAEIRLKNKKYIDEAQEDMDKAVQEFIARGGLPK